MYRKIIDKRQGYHTIDGDGVHLVRVLSSATAVKYDPFLMLDAFDEPDPNKVTTGFPMHPHRGIETVTFISGGRMVHRDHLGTEATVHDGEAQWLTAGSGAYHEEMPGATGRFLGAQLWLNLPAKDKMSAAPAYHGIGTDEIQEISVEGGKVRLITGEYENYKGYQGKYVPLDYYDIHLEAGAELTINVKEKNTVFAFTLDGDAIIADEDVEAKTAVLLADGNQVKIVAKEQPIELLLLSAPPLHEPIVSMGPIVMNTKEEISQAFADMRNGTLVQQNESYE